MPDGDNFDDGSFSDALDELLREAETGDVDPLGAWRADRDGDGAWEVLISEVLPDSDGDD